jgi:hypothetical protein
MTALVPNTLKSLIAVLMMAAVILVISPAVHAQAGCEGDISGDGRTDGVDLAIVLTNWGSAVLPHRLTASTRAAVRLPAARPSPSWVLTSALPHR